MVNVKIYSEYILTTNLILEFIKILNLRPLFIYFSLIFSQKKKKNNMKILLFPSH
jgi:hypothetical protein